MTSAVVLLEAGNCVATVVMLVPTVVGLLTDGINLSLLIGVVAVTLPTDVILLAVVVVPAVVVVVVTLSGAILFPFTEAACA